MTQKITTTRQAMSACRKAGVNVDRVVVPETIAHRDFSVRSENAARRVAKVTGWDYTRMAWGGYMMTAEPFSIHDPDNCK